MFRPEPILRFLGWFVLIFGLLVAPGTGLPAVYAKALRKGGEWFFSSLGRKAVFRFRANPGDKLLDTVVIIGNREKLDARGQGPAVTLTFSSRNLAYFPAALVVALVLASPVNWKRRLRALLGGLVCIHAFIGFSIGVLIVMKLGVNPSLGLLRVPPWLDATALFLDELLLAFPGPRYAVVVLIWILVTFRRDDWQNLLARKETAPRSTV